VQLEQENVCPKGQADPDNESPDKWSANEWQWVKEKRNILHTLKEGKLNG
jgi:hypothetical protein